MTLKDVRRIVFGELDFYCAFGYSMWKHEGSESIIKDIFAYRQSMIQSADEDAPRLFLEEYLRTSEDKDSYRDDYLDTLESWVDEWAMLRPDSMTEAVISSIEQDRASWENLLMLVARMRHLFTEEWLDHMSYRALVTGLPLDDKEESLMKEARHEVGIAKSLVRT